MTRRVLIVCGCRDYDPDCREYDPNERNRVLDGGWLRGIVDALGIQCIRHGGARGVDTFAAKCARRWNIHTDPHPADWSGGPRGGPERNRRMLQPDVLAVAAWPSKTAALGKGGTLDMVTHAIVMGYPVILHPFFTTTVDLQERRRQVSQAVLAIDDPAGNLA